MSENALGKASDSNSDSDKEFSCPTCGDSFSSERGMKVHHKRIHGESIAGRTVECSNCGKMHHKDTHEAKSYDEHYCSDECHKERFSERYSGENNPFWSGGKVTVECAWCGAEVERIPAEVEPGKEYFCDLQNCNAKYQSGIYSGEGNPNWKGGEASCTWCGSELDRDMNQIERSEHFFCGDKDCKAKWQSQHVTGEDHPRWMGGYDGYYGPDWPEARLEALIRDQSRCQVCDKTPCDLSSTLVVHHIQPMRTFKEKYDGREVFERANRLGNLMTLCRRCHMRWEGIPLRPQ